MYLKFLSPHPGKAKFHVLKMSSENNDNDDIAITVIVISHMDRNSQELRDMMTRHVVG